jgi:hypothetical protein
VLAAVAGAALAGGVGRVNLTNQAGTAVITRGNGGVVQWTSFAVSLPIHR